MGGFIAEIKLLQLNNIKIYWILGFMLGKYLAWKYNWSVYFIGLHCIFGWTEVKYTTVSYISDSTLGLNVQQIGSENFPKTKWANLVAEWTLLDTIS